jgi:YegS/Rv2252/BmrU family lipid kinase
MSAITHSARETRLWRVHVIANPAAGRDVPILGVLNSAFKAAGMDWDLFLTKEAGDAERLARESVTAGADLVAVYGGDGTVMEVASGLLGTETPLAILPGGTANVMSVELGIPADLPAAVALLCGSEHAVRTVDMARVKNRLFLLRITTGITAEMTKTTEREAKNRIGSLAYVISLLRAVPTTPSSRYQITLDGEQVESEGVACLIANSASMGIPGLKMARAVNIDDGLLDVIVIRSADVNQLVQVAANAIGLAEGLPHWQAREITLVADPPQPVECDGEILDLTPVSASIVPHAARIIVPTTTLAAQNGDYDDG